MIKVSFVTESITGGNKKYELNNDHNNFIKNWLYLQRGSTRNNPLANCSWLRVT